MKKLLIILFLIPVYIFADFDITQMDIFARSFVPESPNAMIIKDDLLLQVSNHGLEIYRIEESGELNKLSNFLMRGFYTLDCHDDTVYITRLKMNNPSTISNSIVKLDISDPENPTLIQLNEFEDFILGGYMTFQNGYLISSDTIYDAEDLSSVEMLTEYSGRQKKMNNTYFSVNRYDAGTFIYNFIDPLNPELICTLPTHNYSADNFFSYLTEDNKLVTINNDLMMLWNFINGEAELLSSYEFNGLCALNYDNHSAAIMGDKLIVNCWEQFLIFDVSGSEFILENQCSYDLPQYFLDFTSGTYEENYYLSTSYYGIVHYKLIDNELVEQGRYQEHQSPRGLVIVDDNIILNGISEIYNIDISDPLNPVEAEETIPGESFRMKIDKINERAIFIDFSTESVQIYDCSNPDEFEFVTTYSLSEYNEPWLDFDPADPDNFYIVDIAGTIAKYRINNDNTISQEWQNSIMGNINFTIKNGILYTTDGNDLRIYSGLESGDLVLENSIDYEFSSSYNPILEINENQLFISGITFTPVIYDLSDPLSPEFITHFPGPGVCSITDDLLYHRDSCHVSVYEKDFDNNIPEPIYEFNSYSHVNGIYQYEHNDEKYLYFYDYDCVEIYQYNYEVGTGEFEIIPVTNTLTNYPNPFNPSTEIRFQSSEFSDEDSEIEIYNIKGQKIKTFPVTLSDPAKPDCIEGRQTHRVTWDGTDSQHNPVSSGVYFAVMKSSEGKTLASRKMMLLK